MVWRAAKKLEITATDEKDVFNGVVTIFSLNVQLSQTPKQEWIPEDIGLQIKISSASATTHPELDLIYLRISSPRVSHIDSEQQLIGFVERLKDAKCYLGVQQHQQNTDSTMSSLSILEARVNYLLYYIFRYTHLASSEHVHFARNVLQSFQQATWYRSGIGSLEAADCALSLASSTVNEDLRLLDHTKEVLKSIAPYSNISRGRLPEVEETMEYYSRAENLVEAYLDEISFQSMIWGGDWGRGR
jgi:hypothetical protein